MLIPAAVDRLRRERAAGRKEGRREGELLVAAAEEKLRRERAELRAEIAKVIRNGGTAAEALARVEEIVNGNGEELSGSS